MRIPWVLATRPRRPVVCRPAIDTRRLTSLPILPRSESDVRHRHRRTTGPDASPDDPGPEVPGRRARLARAVHAGPGRRARGDPARRARVEGEPVDPTAQGGQ